MSNRKIKSRSNTKHLDDQCTDMRDFLQASQPTESTTQPSEYTTQTIDQQELNDQSTEINQRQVHNDDNQLNTEDFMKLFQVDRLINPKYGNNRNSYAIDPAEKIKQLPIDQLVEMTLLFKLSNEMEFIRHINVSECGRKFTKQIDLCLETLKNLLEVSPDQFKTSLNGLVQKQKQICGQ